MRILVDSDILVEVMRGRDPAISSHWEDLAASGDSILCSPISLAELWHGARPREHKALGDLFGALICVPIDAEIGRRAGQYLRVYHKSHSVELGDALIAATAKLHNAALWTRNRKHYPMPDLEWYGSR